MTAARNAGQESGIQRMHPHWIFQLFFVVWETWLVSLVAYLLPGFRPRGRQTRYILDIYTKLTSRDINTTSATNQNSSEQTNFSVFAELLGKKSFESGNVLNPTYLGHLLAAPALG